MFRRKNIPTQENSFRRREREKFIARQPPKWGKDNYSSANSWISGGLPGSGRRRRRGDGLNGSSFCGREGGEVRV